MFFRPRTFSPTATGRVTIFAIVPVAIALLAFFQTGASSPASTNHSNLPPRAQAKVKRPHLKRTDTAPPLKPWTAHGTEDKGGFAFSAAGIGDVNGDGFDEVLVTIPGADGGRGRVVVYAGSTNGPPLEPRWSISIDWEGQPFGMTATGAGDVNGDGFADVVVANTWKRLDDGAVAGHVRVYFGSPNGLGASPGWNWTPDPLRNGVYPAANCAGDVNGDGFDDLAISAYAHINNTLIKRGILVFHGSTTGLGKEPDWIGLEEQQDSGLGYLQDGTFTRPVSSAGDVNGDGFGDLIVGAPCFSGPYRKGGKVYVYYGSPQGLGRTPGWSTVYDLPVTADVDEDHEQNFGHAVGCAGDVNGDGFDDIIVGARFADHGDINEGLAFVYFGSTNGPNSSSPWRAEGNRPHTHFGWSVSTVGDVNGDGFADILVGAPYATDGQITEGAAGLFLGSHTGPSRLPDWTVESDHYEGRLGSCVSSAGDVNGDGYGDFLVTEPGYNFNGAIAGRVLVYFGRPGPLPFSHDWRIDKPWLMAAQQKLDLYHIRWGATAYFIPWAPVVVVMCAVFLIVQHRLRRRIARLLAENKELVQTQERRHAARNLHDDLSVQIALLNSQDQAAAKAARLAVKSTIAKLDPTRQTIEGLVTFLGDHAEDTFANTDIKCFQDVPIDLPSATLQPTVCEAIIRCFNEALANILRHAHATEVWLRIAVTYPQLRVTIEDNGNGPGEAALDLRRRASATPGQPPARGNGLRNMRERMTEIGGSFDIGSRPEGGTRVVFFAKLASSP